MSQHDSKAKDFKLETQPCELFLTGATGFLGAFLLDRLLQQTPARVHCLVRASTYWEAEARLKRNLEHFKLWKPEYTDRIVPVVGDLTKPLLDLDERDFKRLGETVQGIYHNGAYVNFINPYSRLKAANVFGTQEALRLACTGTLKPLHYTSTLRIFGGWPGRDGVVRESDEVDQSQVIESGYSQSKWVAEKLVRSAAARGIPVTIFRPGMITGDTVNGMANFTDIIGRMIKGCIQMGCAPKKEMLLDFTPVDWAIGALVHLSLKEESLGKIFHLATPHPVPWTRVADLIRELGYELRELDYETWLDELKRSAQRQTPEENALIPLLSYFVDEMPDEVANRRFDCQNVLDGLRDVPGSDCPEVDRELMQTYLEAYIREGFLTPPPAGLRSSAA